MIQELTRIALFDMRELLDEHGNVKPPSEWSDVAAAVGQLEVITRQDDHEKGASARVSRVRLWDKVNALVHLGRHLGGLREPRDEGQGLQIENFQLCCQTATWLYLWNSLAARQRPRSVSALVDCRHELTSRPADHGIGLPRGTTLGPSPA